LRSEIAVLGLGNELFTDEGLGVVASRRIEGLGLPDIEVIDGGTLGLSLLPSVESRRGLLVLDSIMTEEGRPGDVVVYDGDALRRESRLLYSAHQLGVNEILAATDLMGTSPMFLAAVGMVPASLETGYGISAVVEAAMSEMVRAALQILTEWGAWEVSHA
jgi:hydrogenase maturation protease